MPSPELSKNGSFYQLACHTTDTFTSCIRIYEALLPYFEAETPGDIFSKRLFSIGDMLTTLYNELTTFKNEVTLVVNDEVSEQRVECKGLADLVPEHIQQENIIYEASSVEQKVFHSEKVLDKLPQRSWEYVRQVPDEVSQREKNNQEVDKMEQTISRDEKMCIKPTGDLKKQASDLGYICGNCNQTVTVYNQDLELSFALHNQDGCCRGKQSELVSVQKERQEKKFDMVSAQGQVQNLTKCQKATSQVNLTSAQLDTVYKAGDTRFSCIQPMKKGFLCTVCNKNLAGSKNFDEHVKGSYHQTILKESGKEINKSTAYGTNVTCGQLVKSSEKKSAASVAQEENAPSPNVQLAGIIKSLSGSLYVQRQYLSVEKDVIMCNLCGCQIPPTATNVRDHLLGSRHSKRQTELQSAN